MAEMRGFVVAVSFLLIYSTLLGTVPAGFLTVTYEPPTLSPIDPQLISGFDGFVMMNSTNFTAGGVDYGFGGHLWTAIAADSTFTLFYRQVIFFVIPVYTVNDMSFETFARGTSLTWITILEDSDNGTARYSAVCPFATSGLVFVWNVTDYVYPWEAWGNGSLTVVHGIGADAYAPQNALSLVLAMLTFSVPEIPVILQVLLNTPIYAMVAYLVWFLIKEVIPFV